MPPKTKVMQPIDRPLSRAYARDFKGWSTAEPPGISDPTTFREMENVMVNRDGSARVRPGLRYLSYETPPYDTDMVAGGGPSSDIPEPSGVWEEWSMMPTGTRQGHAAIAAGGKLYVAGGYRMDGSSVAEFEIYDTYSGTWSTGAPMPELAPNGNPSQDQYPKAYGHVNAAGHYRGKLYVFAASNELNRENISGSWYEWGYLYKLYVYDIDTDTWETKPGPPVTRYPNHRGSGNQVANGRLHCFSFARTSEWSTNGMGKGFWIYDIQSETWAPGPDYNSAVGKTQHSTVAMPDGRVWQAGGSRYIDPFNNVYTPATNNWAEVPTWVGDVRDGAMARHNGILYFSGGYTVGGGQYPQAGVRSYNIETGAISTNVSPAMPATVTKHVMTVVGTTLYTVGGSSSTGKQYRRKLGGFPDEDTYDTNEDLYTIDGLGGGVPFPREFVGTHEAFYLADGRKAYLCAVREEDDSVGFRVMMQNVNGGAMFDLQDPLVNFTVDQPLEVLNFSADTTYVKYLQIDNKIFALSDNGENMRIFTVGDRKEAKALASITRPEWENDDKLEVVHPDADWINGSDPIDIRRNKLPNPSFELSLDHWNSGANTELLRPPNPSSGAVAGNRAARLMTLPERTNLVERPLHDVATTGITGWRASGDAAVSASTSFLKVAMGGSKGRHYARTDLQPGIKGRERYRVAFDFDLSGSVTPSVKLKWYGQNGAQLEDDVVVDVDGAPGGGTARFSSGPRTAPKGAVSVRVCLGGDKTGSGAAHVLFKNVVLCPADEPTTMFHGGSGTNYFWTGTANKSSSVYHPPKQVMLTAHKVSVGAGKAHAGSMSVYSEVVRDCELRMRFYNRNEVELVEELTTTPSVATAWTRVEVGTAAAPANSVLADVRLTIPAVARGEKHWVDAAMLEAGVSVAGAYFDGDTADTATFGRRWRKKPHQSPSVQEEYAIATTVPAAETRTVDTLIGTGGPSVNEYQFGFFYTFNNEVGESAASKITRVRTQRGWTEWAWETPNISGEPSGTTTRSPEKCADQLVAYMPEEVFDEAVAQGAISWSLYMFTWSPQDAAPVTALKVGTKEIPLLADYNLHGWQRVTPVSTTSDDITVLPTEENRYNYSDPSRAGNGLVVGDRMVMVNDPTAAAVIRWSSNRQGEYSNFTASKGGGFKTLTSGNLYVPAAVKLWQNPQSADTICILCLGTDGYSTSYYMAPAQIAAQSEATNIFSFEETTATPGTTSPYGVEIFNNSMYHPIEDQLMKSTASNYNINHKSQTEPIRNMWEKLASKQTMISSQHDSRLYFIVTNPEGEPVKAGCNGNEIWVFDAAAENGTWSRFLVQAHSLRKIEFGGRIYMSVIRPDGVYYFDPEYPWDDVIDSGLVWATPIPWKLVTNTQGANRAHDAWCHLRQMAVTLGYFQGRMRFGIRSVDINGKAVEISKVVRDVHGDEELAYDIEEQLRVQRDLKEWYFFAESLTTEGGGAEPCQGQVSLVQYRYAPISVNVGYENGSIETFEYGRDVALAESTTTENGVPMPLTDIRRP